MERAVSHRAGERGAIEIKTVLMLLLAAAVIFVVIKVTPVYVGEQSIARDLDELARIAANRGLTAEKINQQIEDLRIKHELPENSITLARAERGKVAISVNYTVPIDLVVTTFNWQVDYQAEGKGF